MSWFSRIKSSLFSAPADASVAKSTNAFNVFARGDDNGGLTGKQISQPYKQSIWVMAAIRHIANPVSAVPLQFSAAPKGTNQKAESGKRKSSDALLNDPALDAFWKQPAKGLTSFAEFIKATIGWRKMVGEAFWILDDSALVPFPEVRQSFPQLIIARPDMMRHVVAAGVLEGWVFTDAGGRSHNLTPEQVVHLKQWNPYDAWRGLGEYEAARIDAETNVANTQFLKSLAESNGDQGVYVVAKNGIPDDAQKTQIIAQLREKRMLQQRGVFKPIFLAGDISIEDPQVRTADAAFLDSYRLSAQSIFVAFGVPPSMSGPTASYSIGSASDYYRLILDTCQPEANEIAQAIANVSARLTGRSPLHAWFDWSSHPVLQAVRKEALDSLGKLCDRGMPIHEAGEYLDLSLPRFDGDEIGYLPIGITPASDASLGMDYSLANEPADPAAADPASDPTAEADPVAMALRAIEGRAKASVATPPAEPLQRARDAKEVRAWQGHMRQRQGAIKLYKSAFTKSLMGARGEVLRKLEAADSAKSEIGNQKSDITHRAGAADFLFDLGKFAGTLRGFMRKAGERTLTQAGEQVFAELGKTDPFVYPPAKALQFLQDRANKMTDVSQETFDRVKAVLEDGLTAGNTMSQLADLVRGEFNDMSRSRALTVAMTESAAAYGDARQEGMNQAGVEWKKWLTSGADNVRAAHAEANGQIVPADETFDVGNEMLMHPGDEAGSAGNVINCHCVAIAVEKGPSES